MFWFKDEQAAPNPNNLTEPYTPTQVFGCDSILLGLVISNIF